MGKASKTKHHLNLCCFVHCSCRRSSAQAGQGREKGNWNPLTSCSSPLPESGLQSDFQQGNSGHKLRGLWRKRLQKLLQIPAGLETSTPCPALHCQVPPQGVPALVPSTRDKASAAKQFLPITASEVLSFPDSPVPSFP